MRPTVVSKTWGILEVISTSNDLYGKEVPVIYGLNLNFRLPGRRGPWYRTSRDAMAILQVTQPLQQNASHITGSQERYGWESPGWLWNWRQQLDSTFEKESGTGRVGA
jgi:hypothetical protein